MSMRTFCRVPDCASIGACPSCSRCSRHCDHGPDITALNARIITLETRLRSADALLDRAEKMLGQKIKDESHGTN